MGESIRSSRHISSRAAARRRRRRERGAELRSPGATRETRGPGGGGGSPLRVWVRSTAHCGASVNDGGRGGRRPAGEYRGPNRRLALARQKHFRASRGSDREDTAVSQEGT